MTVVFLCYRCRTGCARQKRQGEETDYNAAGFNVVHQSNISLIFVVIANPA
jgi:hypothetical protein